MTAGINGALQEGRLAISNIGTELAQQTEYLRKVVEGITSGVDNPDFLPLRANAVADANGLCTVLLVNQLDSDLEAVAYAVTVNAPTASTIRFYTNAVDPINMFWADPLPASGFEGNRIPAKIIIPHNAQIFAAIAGQTAGTSQAFVNLFCKKVQTNPHDPYPAVYSDEEPYDALAPLEPSDNTTVQPWG
jgi:hypothetical protein